jgi:U3 small nucleolar RNA-associated protein 20
MSKRSGRLGGKGAPGSARAAVLNALAALHPPELIPLLELLLLPISGCFTVPQPSDSSNSTPAAAAAGAAAAGAVAAGAVAEMDACRLIPAPWWSKHLVNGDLSWWLSAVDRSKLAAQPLRRRQGFLNAFEDLLGHLGFRVQALLPPLMAITLHLLEQACSSLQQAQDGEQGPAAAAAAAAAAAGGGGEGREEGRALRSQTLRLFAQIFARFPNAVDFNPLWPGFFAAVNPLMQRLVPEAVAAVAPPLLAATAALAAAPGLARVLGNLPSQQQQQQQGEEGDESDPSSMQVDTSAAAAPAAADGGPTAAWPEGLGPKPTWAAQGLGAQLLSSCFAVLSAKGCSEGTRDVALTVAESCIALQDSGLLSSVLLPHTSQLLGELRVSIEGVLAAAAAASARARGGPRGGKVRRTDCTVHATCVASEAYGA